MVDLRSELKSRKLSTTGSKPELVERLKKVIQAEPVSSQQNPDSKDRIQSASSNDEGGREDSGCKASNSLELYSSSGMCMGFKNLVTFETWPEREQLKFLALEG